MITYRIAVPSDYMRLAEIHVKAFEGFFLTTLGIKFLQTYYYTCLKHEKTIAVCACDEHNEIIGFASGTIWSKGYNKSIVFSNIVGFGLAFLRIVLTKPKAIIRLQNNMNKDSYKDDKGDYAELLSIAILPSYKGHGIGKNMLLAFEKAALEKNSEKISLTTDYFNNHDVIEFYKRSGYEVLYDLITYPDRHMLRMLKTLDK